MWNPVRLFLEILLLYQVKKTGEADYPPIGRQASMFFLAEEEFFFLSFRPKRHKE